MILSKNRVLWVAASASGEPPALLTSTSIRPWRAVTASTSRATASASAHIAGLELGRPGTRRRRRRRGIARADDDARTMARKRSAIARPMPWVPPVTSTTRPVKSTMLDKGLIAICVEVCYFTYEH